MNGGGYIDIFQGIRRVFVMTSGVISSFSGLAPISEGDVVGRLKFFRSTNVQHILDVSKKSNDNTNK